MFQFPTFASHYGMTGLLPAGLPHSDIYGSKIICISPQLFAAYHVLRRLREPRHPPSALAYFLLPFNTFVSLGLIFLQLALFLSYSILRCPSCQRSSFVAFRLLRLSLHLVENNGFEPLTLCVQSRCSSQLS
jgi:hypothetical protein